MKLIDSTVATPIYFLTRDQPWDFFVRNDAKAETPVLWPPHAKSWLIGKDWCWEGLGAGGEGDDQGWDGWMASRTRWTWIWVNSGSWWWTGRPGVLQFMRSQRVGHDWVTELNWTEWFWKPALWREKSFLERCPKRLVFASQAWPVWTRDFCWDSYMGGMHIGWKRSTHLERVAESPSYGAGAGNHSGAETLPRMLRGGRR